jgi:NDP-sugar pyrophosphorylase family protein
LQDNSSLDVPPRIICFAFVGINATRAANGEPFLSVGVFRVFNAVVLAGGVRSGLEVPGSGLPRALWPFPAQPLISNVLSFLTNAGIEKIAICANGKTKLIASELSSGNSPWLNLHYSEDPLPRGPAGCLRDLQDWLGDDTFVCIQATAAYDFDLKAMLEEHRRTGAAITVGARPSPEDPQVLEPAGVYLVEPKTLALIQPVGFQDFKEQFLPKVIAAGMTVRCHTLKGTATLIHSAGHYLSAIREAILRAAENLPAGFVQKAPGVVVHENATIDPTARLTGPVWIDSGAQIGAGAVLAGPVVVGPDARVGAGAVVHRTVVMKDGEIGSGTEVYSAILAPSAVRTLQAARKTLDKARSSRLDGAPATGIRSRVGRMLSVFAAK